MDTTKIAVSNVRGQVVLMDLETQTVICTCEKLHEAPITKIKRVIGTDIAAGCQYEGLGGETA